MKRHTLIFFSSSPIAIPLFEALLKDPRFKILALICQPDKMAGRNMEISIPKIKTLAINAGIPVHQAENLSQAVELLNELKKNPPEILLSFSYGQFLNENWLKLPSFAPLNIHPSLLPLYRGPTPIQSAILNGDCETGISLIKMEKGMDDGDLAFQEKMSILANQNSELLFEAVAKRACEIIPEALIALFQKGESAFIPQDSGKASICKLITRENGFIDFQKPASSILNQLRAYTPWPGVYTTYKGKRLKLLDFSVKDMAIEPGKVFCEKNRIFIGSSDSALDINLLQLEGKSALKPEAFIAGQPQFHGSQLPS